MRCGKQQTVTYDTVKDHIIKQIQKTYKYGIDMAKSLRDMQHKTSLGNGPPIQCEVTITDDMKDFVARVSQDGYNIEYTKELRSYNLCMQIYEENKYKAYIFILGHCNKVMQNRIEEASDFESQI